MKNIVIGILAHVDAGKTTLAESLLYLSGSIRKLGRVDKKDAFLDNFELERARGITIFSKQAILKAAEKQFVLLDTPGHVDFSTEMERTLQVLDYAILVISGIDGVQAQTKTLWRLLNRYQIPVFLFINKMDLQTADQDKLLKDVKTQLSESCVVFGQPQAEDFYEQVALADEALLEAYLERGQIDNLHLREAIRARRLFPCFFGSALKLKGVETLLQGMTDYTVVPAYPPEFAAKVYKISRDEQGNRLTHLKITGGKLKVKDVLGNGVWEEKVNQIRIYSGERYETAQEVEAGMVCAVTGLTQTKPGEGLGTEQNLVLPLLEPILTYQIVLPSGCDPRAMLPKLRQLEEEEPALQIVWDEQLQEIRVQVMGEMQCEILQKLILARFGLEVTFAAGKIVYKETITNVVEGVGHFEPAGRYAEVQLLLEPGERGSGLQFADNCSDDLLDKKWRQLILTHLQEKVHKGVLTGSAITDMKITLTAGRAHNKLSDGGDFREAVDRAVRQGLMEAESLLLEPYYAFQLELPEQMAGRALTDIERMSGTCRIAHLTEETAVLTGTAPVVELRHYQQEVQAYTGGRGRLYCSMQGYDACHNPDEVIERIGYDAEQDTANPTGSVFYEHGSSLVVPWDKVKDYMHGESVLQSRPNVPSLTAAAKTAYQGQNWLEPEEVDKILQQTYFANQGKSSQGQKRRPAAENGSKTNEIMRAEKADKAEYLLVDGYNIIFAWDELRELAADNLDAARAKLLDYLSKYQNVRKNIILVVFDAYRVPRQTEEIIDHDELRVIFTRENQTADQYIEKFARENQEKYEITVATSDSLEQMIIRGDGCTVISAAELKEEIDSTNVRVMQVYREKQVSKPNRLKDVLSETSQQQMAEFIGDQGEAEE